MSRILRTIAGAVVLAVFCSTAASAAPLERDHFHDVWTEVEEDFCGDLLVQTEGDVFGSFVFVPRGPDGLAYWSGTVHGTIQWTNLANGLSLQNRFAFVERDQEVVDNGDGTLTITVLLAGSGRFWGPDGRLFTLDSGQLQYQVLIDHMGTPNDPSDDEFIANLGVVKDTGRDEYGDFCDIVHTTIG